MSSTIEHFSHPEHELTLKENDVFEDTATCYVCNRTVIGSPTYTCTNRRADDDDNDIRCKKFYLHQTCAELPPHLFQHDMHNQHLLSLELRSHGYYCDRCELQVKFAYVCDPCNYGLCVACTFPCPPDDEQRELHHEGHQEHTLVLLQRQALFKCDACWVEAKDISYICKTCEFWIHKKCALSPSIIAEPANHHHPLHLIFSIPDEHRYFSRWCNICSDYVPVDSWMYYCHQCTYFVHMKCATAPALNETEAAGSDNHPDLIEFPLHSLEALSDFMTPRFSKFQVDFEREHKDATATGPNDQHRIEEHWSHPDHPLELFQFTTNEHDDDDEEDDDNNTTGLICDGCIQPITVTHPSYYGCTQCKFLLHSVCATKLPIVLPIGSSSSHPQHSLALTMKTRFYAALDCGVCGCATNGFYYICQACDMKIDICCAFLPSRIKYKSHNHHPLILRPLLGRGCSVSRTLIIGGMEYGCEICSNFLISVSCVFYPSTMKHKYDDHSITLRYPPFFYQGVFYCELCEGVNNQWWLYHCDESDHSFHSRCLCKPHRVKLGGTIILDNNEEKHTFVCVYKLNVRKNSPLYICVVCRLGYSGGLYLECEGCGVLICPECMTKIEG
ncbi:hypothetical protein DCAR_0209614 [Daucus carota subsp. sativus]|uniref:DC1 domain-containing protein n=1 Tax=Daucus carota subsp. sativus TaxID=79200 RepID=A0AAF0WM11_DAUCS|nr:PREDICTED: uncharacterized protein LOC108209918 isoform X1 [Daucus carota subsp. sativus]XP_017236620.1 PREDICTED: uncharacterized protein LOC108209918 isoform X1 [Daucus carota subsp. sativus]WOG90370.1 hypothetical protein DCAR_0209614 [Daucus carota subsp. sativus]